MANNPKRKLPIQVVFAIILAVATIGAIVIAIMPTILPTAIRSTPTAQVLTPTLPILSKQSFPETSVASTSIPNLAGTSTMLPTDTPVSTFMPTSTSTAQPLPNLIVAGISDPICTKDQRVTPEKLYVKLSIIVRNIGPGSTRPFGPFSVRVNLVLGQHHYSLEEWASGFNGVLGSSNMDTLNLNPNDDVKLNLSIDLKGNMKFGIEAIVNSGLHTIPESNTTNNSLIQSFSVICT